MRVLVTGASGACILQPAHPRARSCSPSSQVSSGGRCSLSSSGQDTTVRPPFAAHSASQTDSVLSQGYGLLSRGWRPRQGPLLLLLGSVLLLPADISPRCTQLDLHDEAAVKTFLADYKPELVVHCAAERRPDAVESVRPEPPSSLVQACAGLRIPSLTFHLPHRTPRPPRSSTSPSPPSCRPCPARPRTPSSSSTSRPTTSLTVTPLRRATSLMLKRRRLTCTARASSRARSRRSRGSRPAAGAACCECPSCASTPSSPALLYRLYRRASTDALDGLLRRYGKAESHSESAINVLVESVRKAARGESVKMDNWAKRYPTNVADIARVLVELAGACRLSPRSQFSSRPDSPLFSRTQKSPPQPPSPRSSTSRRSKSTPSTRSRNSSPACTAHRSSSTTASSGSATGPSRARRCARRTATCRTCVPRSLSSFAQA